MNYFKNITILLSCIEESKDFLDLHQSGSDFVFNEGLLATSKHSYAATTLQCSFRSDFPTYKCLY